MTSIPTHESIAAECATHIQRRFARVVGRGTTALYVALRALALRDTPGEIILPDVTCSTVLDAVLLAGFTPIFADSTTDRFAMNADSIRRRVTPATRAVILSHIFGYTNEAVDLGIPIIEDAVQGLGGMAGGKPIGTLGDIAFTSFHPTKMINGQGGLVATDDPALWDAIQQVSLVDSVPPPEQVSTRYQHYFTQLAATRDMLIRPFDDRAENVARIAAGWSRLAANVAARNERARYLREGVADLRLTLPLTLPSIQPGDAIWRYTFAAPTLAVTRWILRHLQAAGLSGSALYPSLSNLFEPNTTLASVELAPRLINLWVDDATDQAALDQMIAVLHGVPRKFWGSS
ncbi:MAG: DegT/DnrJ/EryC1/StrS family aminotransferase [Chloroflexota bacterium]